MIVDRGWLLATAILLVILTVMATRRMSRWLERRRGGRGRRRGLAGERIARKLLKRAGYRVRPGLVGESHVIVDGVRCEFPLRTDLLAERDGLVYLVEVKTGRRRSPTLDTTRRQLLEYWLTFNTDGVLLVDADERSIATIEFEY